MPRRPTARCAACGIRHDVTVTCAQHQATLAARRAPACPTCGKRHAGAVTCAQHRATLDARHPPRPACETCGKRHAGAVTCGQHQAALDALRAPCATCGKSHGGAVTCAQHRATLDARRAPACATCGNRHLPSVSCADRRAQLDARRASRQPRSHSACVACHLRHDVAISCGRHAAALARARRDAKGVTHDGDRHASNDRVHFPPGELRARAARDPSPVPADRIRDMGRAAHDHLHAYDPSSMSLPRTLSAFPAPPHVLASCPAALRPDHVCLVCQLEFSSLPIRPQRHASSWSIGRVIDRGHPKLCFPKTLQPLDPAMRVQCRVDVPGLRPPRAKKLHVRAPVADVLRAHQLTCLVASCRYAGHDAVPAWRRRAGW